MSSSQNGSPGLDALLAGAASTGTLSKAALQSIRVVDATAMINGALGVSVDDVKASEVVIVSLLLDDSSSISQAGNTQVVRDGHNLLIDALKGSKQKGSILVMCMSLNRGLVYPYSLVENVPYLTDKNYRPQGSTPLYDKSVAILAAATAKSQEFQDNGVTCRSIVPIITDGADYGSHSSDAGDVKKVVSSLLKTESFIIAGLGIDDGGQTNFTQVFSDMGIPSNWILTPKNSPQEIRMAFNTLSQKSVSASQAKVFSQAAMGGFGTP